MTGLSMVRMISHVGVRLMVRQGGGGHSTDGLQDKSRRRGSVGRSNGDGSTTWPNVRYHTTARPTNHKTKFNLTAHPRDVP